MMKKKIMGLVLAGSLVGGGVTFAATTNYYAGLLTGQKEQMEQTIQASYDQKLKDTGKQVHNDMVMYVDGQQKELADRMNSYLDSKLGTEKQESLNEHSKEVDKAVKQLEKDLQNYVDRMVDAK